MWIELLKLFQKNKKKYLQLQQEGVWVPFVSLDLVGHCVKIRNLGEEFSDEWEEKFEYEGKKYYPSDYFKESKYFHYEDKDEDLCELVDLIERLIKQNG